MNKFYTLLLGCLSLTACQTDSFDDAEADLVGRWEFIEVTEQPRNSKPAERESVIEQYQDDEIEFLSDGALIYTEAVDTGKVALNGIWSLTLGESEFMLTMSLIGLNGELAHHTWSVITLRDGNLFAIETTKDIYARYDLLLIE